MLPVSNFISVILVHGFTGNPDRTWRHNPESHPPALKVRRLISSKSVGDAAVRSSVYWPQDLLPTTIPNARVLTWGYDTNIKHSLLGQPCQSTVYDFAYDLLVALEAERRTSPLRPIIFVAHSLGGIIVKELLRRSHGFQNHQRHLHDVYNATKAILFLGTPHSGADPRGFLHRVAERVVRAAGFTVNDQVVKTLLPSSERLHQLRDVFGPMAHERNWIIYCFQEQYGVKALENKKVVEDPSSMLNDAIIEITQHIASNHMDMCRFKGADDVEYLKVAAALTRVQDEIHRSSTTPKNSENSNLTGAQREALLESLAFPQIDARLLNIKRAHEKTCSWLLDQPEYQAWLNPANVQAHHGFLWVKGKAGTGKSTIMKYILARAERDWAETIIIAFFINARGDILERSTLGMYRSLLYQLLKAVPEIQNSFCEYTCKRHTSSNPQAWNQQELQDCFRIAFTTIGKRPFACFIDALDECREDEVREMVQFLEDLCEDAVSSGSRILIYLSSRHYPHISIEHTVHITIEGQEGHDRDIARYVRSKMKGGKSASAEAIRDEVSEKSAGVFLWVVLVVPMLNEALDHGDDLRERLRAIPPTLDELFEDILTRDDKNKNELVLCLQWILFARQPLTEPELYFGIKAGTKLDSVAELDSETTTTEVLQRYILSRSKGLAEVTRTKIPTVQFIHESVRDYLLLRNGLDRLSNLQGNTIGYSHDRLKKCCETYIFSLWRNHWFLSLKPLGTREESNDLKKQICLRFPLMHYAVGGMWWHADTAQEHGFAQHSFLEGISQDWRLPFSFIEVFGRSNTLTAWIGAHNLLEQYKSRRYTQKANLLYILADMNLSQLISIQLELDPTLGPLSDQRYASPLHACLRKGKEQALRAILRTEVLYTSIGIPKELLPSRVERDFAIQALCKDISDEIFVLENGIPRILGALDTTRVAYMHDILLPSGIFPLYTPHGSTRTEHVYSNKSVTSLLLAARRGAKDIALDLLYDTSLSCDRVLSVITALDCGNISLATLILDRLRQSNNQVDQDTFVLAAEQGYDAAVRYFLQHNIDIDINRRDSRGETALIVAILNGQPRMVDLLLGHGANTEIRAGNLSPRPKKRLRSHLANIRTMTPLLLTVA